LAGCAKAAVAIRAAEAISEAKIDLPGVIGIALFSRCLVGLENPLPGRLFLSAEKTREPKLPRR
jgi:hypothetical protein